MFFSPSVRSEVMRVIEERVTGAQAEYETGCEKIDSEAESQKLALMGDLVKKIVG